MKLPLSLCLSVLLVPAGAGAATIAVASGGDLQAAINAAKPGDTITLPPGAVFNGPYTLPAKGGSSYITIRSAAPDSSLPAAGTRIDPSNASLLPKIRVNQNGPAFATAPAASYWRLMFLEIYPSTSTSSANLVELGAADTSQTSLSSVPQHLVIDRCYLHGNASYGQRRGIALNSGDAQILNSYVSDIKGVSQDTQAIAGWNGPGPYLIQNNYLEAAGENVLFGGSDPYISGLVPSNITIRRNVVSKPLAWMSQSWTIKNLMEFKNVDTVLVDGNTIENNWAAGQQGYAILFTPRNQGGTAPWSVVKNVTVQNNVIRHVAAGFNVLGYDDEATSQQTTNIVIKNNEIYDVSASYGTSGNPGNGWVAVISGGVRDITFDHNTIDSDGDDTIVFYPATSPSIATVTGFVLTNNLLRDNVYGIFGANSQPGNVSLTQYAPDGYVHRNAIGGASAAQYPADNDYPTLAGWLSGFLNEADADYRLPSSSSWKGAATDGTDMGVNFSTLNAAMTDASGGDGSGGSGGGSGGGTAPASSPYTGTPVSVPGRIQAENYDKGGEGVAYHDTTAGNSSGAYRSDDVDIRSTTDVDGAYNVKSVRAGEWLDYTVNIAAAGQYVLDLRVASSGSGGTVHLAVDGTNVSGSISLPDTGGWNTWHTVSTTGVTLPAGTHVLTLAIDANGSGGTAADINWVALNAAGPESTPFTGTPIALPGRVEAENYDKGGEGVAYHDTTSGNAGGVYRSDAVDLQTASDTGGGYKVKSAVAGEWLNYTVSIASGGTYTLDARVCSSGAGGKFHIEVDGVNVTGSMTVPDTGSWNAFTTITKTGVSLPAGTHVFRLMLETNGSSTGMTGNFNWFQVR
jgi:hypothetical protein